MNAGTPTSSAGGLDRRQFVKRASQAAVGAALLPGRRAMSAAAGPDGPSNPTVPIRALGGTGVKLPRLAYGGAALPRVWGNSLSTHERVELVRHAYERGIRYFDTAGNYMESQPILGEGLKDVRNDVFLTTKVETTDPAQVRRAVEKSLQQLQTDRADAILIHGTPGLEQMSVQRALQVHAALLKLRDEKICRFVGLSAHGYFDKALALIKTGGFDLCMLSYGYLPRGYDQLYSPRMQELRNACLAEAHRRGMGIVAMKVIGAGLMGAWAGYVAPQVARERRRRLPGAAIRWTLQDDRVDLLCIGMRLKSDIEANLRTINGDTRFTLRDREVLADFGVRAYESDALKKMRVE